MSERKFAGKYEIQEEIAQWVVGTVYKAHDPDVRRDVALEIINPKMTSDKVFLQRFMREARSHGQLEP